MKMIIRYLLVLCGFNAFGQDAVLKPVIENRASITDYLLSNSIDTSDVYYVKDSMLLPLISKQYGMLAVLIYNRDGNMIRYTNKNFSCVNPMFYLRDMCSLKAYPIDSSNTLVDLNSYIQPFGKAVNTSYDFTVVILFSKTFAIKIGTDNITEWYKSIDKKCKVRVTKVDLDVQQTWSEYNRQLGLKFYEKLLQSK